jgi:hypothetical protein
MRTHLSHVADALRAAATTAGGAGDAGRERDDAAP